MIDIKDPKSQKIILVVIVFLIVAYFWYTKIYAEKVKQIDRLNGDYQALLAKLNQVEQKAKNLEKLKEEYNNLLVSYKPVKKLLPDTLEFSTFLNQIHAAAQTNRSVVLEITPNGSESRDYYKMNKYSIKMATTYHDFGNFLAAVANFPFIVNVSDIKLSQYEDLPKKPKVSEKTIIADIVMITYMAIKPGESPEKEVKKK